MPFQSPIRRGRRCNPGSLDGPGTRVLHVSVPYLSGQALQFASGTRTVAECWRFSPLFVGAGVAMERAHRRGQSLAVSVPYLSGQALQLNSTFYPIFVSTFCQDARQLTALPAGNTGFCDSISVTTREPHA